MKICTVCGNEFKRRAHTTGNFCSKACWYAYYRKHGRGNRERVCPICGVTFFRVGGTYCSLDCSVEARKRTSNIRTCPVCGVKFTRLREDGTRRAPGTIHCSRECGLKGTRNGNRGGNASLLGTTRPGSRGYTWVKVGKEDPAASANGWRLQHRVVMEQKLGRALDPYENVHHVNGDRSDNRPENLELWKTKQIKGIRAGDYHCPGCNCGS